MQIEIFISYIALVNIDKNKFHALLSEFSKFMAFFSQLFYNQKLDCHFEKIREVREMERGTRNA